MCGRSRRPRPPAVGRTPHSTADADEPPPYRGHDGRAATQDRRAPSSSPFDNSVLAIPRYPIPPSVARPFLPKPSAPLLPNPRSSSGAPHRNNLSPFQPCPPCLLPSPGSHRPLPFSIHATRASGAAPFLLPARRRLSPLTRPGHCLSIPHKPAYRSPLSNGRGHDCAYGGATVVEAVDDVSAEGRSTREWGGQEIGRERVESRERERERERSMQ
ncbi:uncharacterized protein A4U43_C04F10510 [Asparagus officinalis]|uniref:Uncharacterized protein n=1 Tax=Asparagus officinalis TaxID=4686 RepID=A0A5P1EZU9_ASPOF|nr:uncharacterized protein A4U43_C04F10510 [Asparagus officinalis]